MRMRMLGVQKDDEIKPVESTYFAVGSPHPFERSWPCSLDGRRLQSELYLFRGHRSVAI